MRKKIMLLMCMAALLVTFFSLSVVSANPGSPDVTVVAAKVDNGTALELGLRIASKNDSFQSTGVVLQYDASALTPCGWADEVTDALLEKASVNPAELEAGKNIWDYAVPLPTKGKDIISGKTAFTVIDTSTTPHTGYLYLNVEAPAPAYGIEQKKPGDMELTDLVEFTDPTPANFGYKTNHGLIDSPDGQAVDQVITVRFALPTEPEQPVDPTPDPEEPTPEPNPDENEPSGQADETGDGTGEGGGTTEPEPTDPTEPDPDNPENPDDPPAEQPDDFMATYGIAVSAATVVDESPAGHSGVYYRTTDTLPEEISNWHFLSVKNGVSVNQGGGSSTEGIIAVTAFDWDGTMLGSFIFAGDPNPEKQRANAQKALDGFMAKENIAQVLTSHAGYDFLAWVKNEDDVPSSYGWRTRPDAKTVLSELELADSDRVDFGTLTESTTVKAGYITNDSIELGADAPDLNAQVAARNYQAKIVGYNRFGTTDNFSITVEVKRGNVPRVTNGYLWVRTHIGDVDSYSRYALKGADEETVQVALYAKGARSGSNFNLSGVSLVEWTVIDDYGYSNWVNAGTAGERANRPDCQSTASGAVRDVGTSKNQAVWDKSSYPSKGIIGSIYDQLVAMDTTGEAMSVTAAHLRSVGIVPSVTNNNNLRNNMLANWVAKGRPVLTGDSWDLLEEIGSKAP